MLNTLRNDGITRGLMTRQKRKQHNTQANMKPDPN